VYACGSNPTWEPDFWANVFDEFRCEITGKRGELLAGGVEEFCSVKR